MQLLYQDEDRMEDDEDQGDDEEEDGKSDAEEEEECKFGITVNVSCPAVLLSFKTFSPMALTVQRQL